MQTVSHLSSEQVHPLTSYWHLIYICLDWHTIEEAEKKEIMYKGYCCAKTKYCPPLRIDSVFAYLSPFNVLDQQTNFNIRQTE